MRGKKGRGNGKEALLSDLPTCFTPPTPFLGEKSCEGERELEEPGLSPGSRRGESEQTLPSSVLCLAGSHKEQLSEGGDPPRSGSTAEATCQPHPKGDTFLPSQEAESRAWQAGEHFSEPGERGREGGEKRAGGCVYKFSFQPSSPVS